MSDWNVSVHGFTAEGYEPLRQALASNLRTGEEHGACLAVYRFGNPVADLWGGTADAAGTPYAADALHVGYSVTKGVVGLILARLVDNGDIDLDRTVAHYWPEFSVGGKSEITVAQLCAHEAGLPYFETEVSGTDLLDWDRCVSLLAAQAPAWKPGTRHGYHALTFGYLVGEVIRRACGSSVGDVLRSYDEEGSLQAWIGLPREHAARVLQYRDAVPAPGVGEVMADALSDSTGTPFKTFQNPVISSALFSNASMWGAEIPGANGIFDARALAKLYSTMVDGPLRRVSRTTVDRFRSERVNGEDEVLLDQPTRFGTVFALSTLRQPLMGSGSFGHDGLGGHLAFAHPESGIACAYLSTRAVMDPTPHPRITRIMAALALCV